MKLEEMPGDADREKSVARHDDQGAERGHVQPVTAASVNAPTEQSACRIMIAGM